LHRSTVRSAAAARWSPSASGRRRGHVAAARPRLPRDEKKAASHASSGSPRRADSELACGRPRVTHAPGFSIVPKQSPEAIERIVEELMDRRLSKAERMQRLRELAKSGDDVPDELMDQALRKLMERLTE
jgi:hypothetical protein